VQEAVKAARWGEVVSLCVEIRNVDPDYRDVSALLTLAASHLAEEEQQRQQERELGEQYEAALELLEAEKYAEAVEALEPIAEQAPDFRDVGGKLEEARTGLEKARLYEAALAKMADERHDEACDDLLALLRRDPDHADARARLIEATEGALAQLTDARAELEKAGSESEALHARVAELEAQLEQAREAVTLYDALAQAVEKSDWERCAEVGERLLQLAPDLDRPRAWLTRARDELARQEALEEGRIVWERDGKEMVRIPAGVFLYGDGKERRELPEFWMDKTPVTNAEYARFVTDTSRKPPEHWKGKTPAKRITNHPVTHVSWHDASAYAEWAGKRLLTEEEWEKAARGTDGREYPWGNEKPTPQLCNFDGNEGSTTPVGTYSPQGDSPYGCVDMAGNVWEWMSSDYSPGSKVLRGGSWGNNQKEVRAANRHFSTPDTRYYTVGFRCAGQPGE
jgi:tetratricopeptide (TPR) repeat protein